METKTKRPTTRFGRLSKEKKRIAIFKDVITQVKLKKFRPTLGAVTGQALDTALRIELSKEFPNMTLHQLNDVDVQDALSKIVKNKVVDCEVCARGSMLITLIMKDNHMNFGQYRSAGSSPFTSSGKNTCDTRLSEIFDVAQIELIEYAFELNGVWNSPLHNTLYSVERAKKFGRKYKTPFSRLIGICTNAINNNGIFKP